MFYDATDFRFARTLLDHADTIRDEYEQLDQSEFRPWVEQDLYEGDGWRVFPFFSGGRYEEGVYEVLNEQYAANIARCPRTVALLKELPGCETAGFSLMMPGTEIVPHHGPERGVYRCHLCVADSEDAALRFANDSRSWRRGECLVFEDTAYHEAWNRGTRARGVLLADFAKACYPA